MVLLTLILLVATVLLNEYVAPKPKIEDARAAGLGDFQVTTATEGRAVPIIFGTVKMSGPNVTWYDDFSKDAIRKKAKTGLWTKKSFIAGWRYRLGLQWGLCRGSDSAPVALRRIWLGEKVLWTGNQVGEGRIDIDEPTFFGGDDDGNGGVQMSLDFYPGTTTQSVNAYLDDPDRQQIATAITPTAPRYTGTCHVVGRELTNAAPTASDRGGYVGNSASIRGWEWELQRFPGLLPGQSAGRHIINSVDCNPANLIAEILTNSEWGFGEASSKLDLAAGGSFLKAEATFRAEGNGISMIRDRVTEARELLREVERQIDGVVFQDIETGLWTIQLAREASDVSWGYDINTVHQFTDDVIDEVKNYSNGDWLDTTNQIHVEFTKREDDYKTSYAPAQNMANAIALAGGSVTTPQSSPGTQKYPGIFNAALAMQIAWRDLRALSRPLKRATFVVNRMAWDLKMANVIAWTDPRRGFAKLPMRVMKIDYGTLEKGKMTVTAVEDVFRHTDASFGDPGATKWTEPSVSLVAYPSGEQLAFEAPRGILVRDPDFTGDDSVAKIFAAARRQGSELGFQIGQRNAVGTPGGTYALAGEAVGFMLIGELTSDLDAGTAIPTSSISVTPGPDGQASIEAEFDDGATVVDLGADLVHLVLVGTEFMLVQTAAISGGNVLLQNVYRGALDSAQENHASGAKVYLLFSGASISDTSIPNTNNVDVELRAESSTEVFAGTATAISFQMAKRALRPYPPSSSRYNGGAAFNTPNLEGDGSGLNGVGFDVEWNRRRYNTADEVAELLADQAPDASTEYRVRVFVDPSGTNTLAYDSGWATGTGPVTPTQAEVIVPAAAGTEIRIRIDARHDIAGEVDLENRSPLIHDVTPTSSRTAQFYLGGDLTPGTASNSYVAAASGTFVVNIGAGYASSIVQYRINGGAWTTAIAAGGGTTGNIPGVAATDTIELRHTVSEGPDPNFVELQDPSASAVAYGCFSA